MRYELVLVCQPSGCREPCTGGTPPHSWSHNALPAPTPHTPAYSTPQPRSRSGTNITGESIQPWATSEQNRGRLYGWHTGPLWVHELDWLQQLLPLEQGTAQGQQSLIKLGPQGFYINNWGAALPLTGQRCYRAERDSPLRLCTGFWSPHTNHTLYEGHNSHHVLRRMWLASLLRPALEKKTLDAHSLYRYTDT